jgi:small subunit ribosomal protein S18
MEEFRRYEGMIIIDPAVQTKGYNDSIKRVEEFIKEKGGTLIYTEKIGMTTLAYEIKKNKKGFYYYFEFTLTPDKISELNTLFRRDEQIIRDIIVVLNKDAIDYNDTERKKKETVKKTLVLVKEEKKKNKYIDPTKKMFCRFDRYGFKNYIDYKNTSFLFKFLNPQGKILPRRLTGNRKKWQRKVAEAIKRARQIAILPFCGDNLK